MSNSNMCNTLLLTSCNRVEQVLLALAINKEIIQGSFNLVITDCSTPHLFTTEAIDMHNSDDPYNLIKPYNFNPHWDEFEDYIKTIGKIAKYEIIHFSPRSVKQNGDAKQICYGLAAANLMDSHYVLKLNGVCILKNDIISGLNNLIRENIAAVWKRTNGNEISTRIFAADSVKLNNLLLSRGFNGWVKDYDFLERKFAEILRPHSNVNYLNKEEQDILVDNGSGLMTRTEMRNLIIKNLYKYNLMTSRDIYIQKFLNGEIW